MIYCVWYPCGGFGSYISSMLDRFGQGFLPPSDSAIEFSHNGNSHNMKKTVPPYRRGIMPAFDFKKEKNYSVLIDDGIDYENDEFQNRFPDSRVLKVCYDAKSWPVIAYTMIVKAMESDLDTALPVDQQHWPVDEDWARREKYFLYLTQHQYQHGWRPDDRFYNIDISEIWNYQSLLRWFESAGIQSNDFVDHHTQWQKVNTKYFKSIHQAQQIIDCIQHSQDQDLGHITDLWDQAVVNYYIWLQHRIEVPANTYANWFENTKQIKDLINGI